MGDVEPTRWHESQSGGTERLVGRSAAGAAVGVEEAIGEGPKAMELSIGEIFTCLERTKERAHAWAHLQPEHEEALDKFIKDLDQSGCELQNSVLVKARVPSAEHGSTLEGSLFEILNCLTPILVLVELLSEQQPEYAVPLKRFNEEVQRARQDLIKKVRPGPGVLSDEN